MSLQTKLLGAALVSLAAFAAAPTFAKDTDLDFRCRARMPGGIKLQARLEERVRSRGTRIKFNAEFEAKPGGAFTVGQQIAISVDSVQVGTVQLTTAPSGELSGELQLDSKLQAGHTPLPPDFPDAGDGSTVTASTGGSEVLSCDLQ